MATTMYVTYGSGTYEDVLVSEQAPQYEYDGKGRPYMKTRTFQIEGILSNATESGLVSAIGSLRSVFGSDDQSFGLYWAGGTATDLAFSSSGTDVLTIRVAEHPHMAEPSGPVYAAGAIWPYRCSVQVVTDCFGTADGTRNLIEFSESVSGFDLNGVAREIGREAIEASPQWYTTCLYPINGADHRIRTVGWHSFPDDPGPILPAAQVGDVRVVAQQGPTLRFPGGKGRRYEIEYQYRYEASGAMTFSDLLRDWV